MKHLYFGGKILTLADPLYAEAMLVEDGRIAAVGREADLRLLGAHTESDLCGKVIMPSFIDAHGHFNSIAASALTCSVRGVGSVGELGRCVSEYIRKRSIPAGGWVRVKDYNEHFFPNSAHPTLEELDAICPDRPMQIAHQTGHSALYNSRALEIAGITASTPSPAGGEICKTDGKPNGYMLEGASALVGKHIPPFSREEMRSGFLEAQKFYAGYGITTVQDGYLIRENLEDYLRMEAEGTLELDVIGYIPVSAYKRLSGEFASRTGGGRVRIGGIKTFADGSPQLRTAWLREPYVGGGNGIPNRSDEAMLAGIRLAAEEGAQVLCHANGDAAVDQFLGALETVEAEHPGFSETRPVVVHAQLMGIDQLPRAKKLGAVVSFFVAHTFHWGDVHARNLGIDRAMKISPVRSALEAGVAVTFHQDPPVILPDMFETVWCAANRITRSGVRLEGEEIGVLEALRAVTSGAAYQYHEENKKGTLEAGKLADFIMLDRDPLGIPKEKLRDIRILATFKEGKMIYKGAQGTVGG